MCAIERAKEKDGKVEGTKNRKREKERVGERERKRERVLKERERENGGKRLEYVSGGGINIGAFKKCLSA